MDDPVPNGTVIYAGDILFQYSETKGIHTEVLTNQQEMFSWPQAGTMISY